MFDRNSKDPGIRFSEIKYAKKDEVRKDLNTSLIDPIWEKIITYRNKFYKEINLKNISKKNYFFTNTEFVVNKINSLEIKINECNKNFSYLEKEELNNFLVKNYQKTIKYFAISKGEIFDDDFINKIIYTNANDIQGFSAIKKDTIDYFLAIKNIKYSNNVSKNYIFYLYNIFSKKSVTSYRTFDLNNFYQKESFLRDYDGAPFNLIDEMMSNLFELLNDNSLNKIYKAITTFYFINFVKPFDAFNKEISLCLLKSLLIKNDICSYIAFEGILLNYEQIMDDIKEANKSSDLTYLFIRLTNIVEEIIDKFNSTCRSINIKKAVIEHQRKIDGEEIEEYIDNQNKDEIEAEKKIINSEENINELAKEENILNSNHVIEDDKKECIKEKNNKEIDINKIHVHSIINSLSNSLSEEEAIKFEKYLLERDPNLRPIQAHFYARHCTLNCYYSIQMFKNFENVVYETARTSMDTLAKFGYYKKEQIKNKFVYTPIKLEGFNL